MLDMLVIDISFRRSCLVFFLTPSKYGTHKLWYFPVLPSYWLSCFSSCANYLAPDPMNSGPKRAVDNLNLTMFAGHYGAGKTTTIVMLTGLIPVDSGSAVIEGHDVGREIDTIRKKPAARFPISSGVPNSELQQEVESMIQIVGLTEKRKEYLKSMMATLSPSRSEVGRCGLSSADGSDSKLTCG
eukprot:gene41284-55839_t